MRSSQNVVNYFSLFGEMITALKLAELLPVMAEERQSDGSWRSESSQKAFESAVCDVRMHSLIESEQERRFSNGSQRGVLI